MHMIESFKEKLAAPPPPSTSRSNTISHPNMESGSNFSFSNSLSFTEESTTPPGSPPANVLASLQSKPAAAAPAPAPASNGSSILEALANMARQTSSAPSATPNLPAPTASYNMPAAGLPQPVSSSLAQAQAQPPVSYPPVSQPVNVSSLPFALPQMPGQSASGAMPTNPSSSAPNPFASLAGAMPAAGATGPGLDPNVQQQILLIKALADQGVPFDKIPALISSMTSGASGPASAAAPQPPIPAPHNPYAAAQPWVAPQVNADESRDRAFQDGVRSPPRYHGRSRSRSPDRGWGARGSPRGGRDRFDYGRDSPNRGRHEERRGGDYRQRSPPGRRGRSPDVSLDHPPTEKWIEYDHSMPSGHIKVLSRTLFVGGVT